jgi:hypothetical protein
VQRLPAPIRRSIFGSEFDLPTDGGGVGGNRPLSIQIPCGAPPTEEILATRNPWGAFPMRLNEPGRTVFTLDDGTPNALLDGAATYLIFRQSLVPSGPLTFAPGDASRIRGIG